MSTGLKNKRYNLFIDIGRSMYIDAAHRDAAERCRKQRNTRARFFPANVFRHDSQRQVILTRDLYFFFLAGDSLPVRASEFEKLY